MIRILFVDDHPERYGPLIERLSPSVTKSDKIVSVTNIRDALEKLRTESFDIMVVDMLLPETPWGISQPEGGAKLLEYLLEDDDLRRPTHIIGITASSEDNIIIANVFNTQPWVLLKTAGGGNPWEQRLETLILHAARIEGEEDQINYGVDICILTALRSPEYEALGRFGFIFEDPIQVDTATFAQRADLTSSGKSLSLIAACCLRMGSVESALLASKVISKYRPKILALGGICAGYEEKVQYGDVIVANPCWDYTSAKLSSDMSGKKVVAYSPDYIEIDTDIASRFDIFKQDKAFLQRIHSDWDGDKLRAPPEIYIAPSATGPAVIADAEVMTTIRREQNRLTIGLEMEAYGVYAAARMASRPRPIVFSAKSVCDYGTMLKDDKYQKYAAYTSAKVIYEFLSRYGSELVSIVR